MRNRLLASALVLLLFLACIAGASAEGLSLSDFAHAKIGVQTGAAEEFAARKYFKEAEITNFSTVTDEALSLDNGKIDGFVVNRLVAEKLLPEYSGFYVVEGELESQDIGFAVSKTEKGRILVDELDAFLAEMAADGELEALGKCWVIDGTGEANMADPAEMTGEKGTIRVAIELLYEPFAYVKNGKPCGLDVDLLYRFGIASGYRMEIVDMSFDAELVSVTTGNCDMAASGLAITDERSESVFFSRPYYRDDIVLMAKQGTGAVQRGSLKNSIYKTFIRENRWQMLLKGIGTTMVITLCAALLGTLLGFGLCMGKRASRWGAAAVNVYIKVFQGTPIVVILMIFYYVIFGRMALPALPIAVLAFGLNFAAYAAEIIRTGIEAVDPGQREAALALGFTEREAFLYYTFPQAAQHFLPVYRGEIVSLLKNTSVVGFITVMDLTKAGDIIRSRTYEAFFPLITVAVIYFVLSFVLAKIIGRIEFSVTPNRKKRSIKGVKLHD